MLVVRAATIAPVGSVGAQFECNRGTDHRILPFEGDREPVRPLPPIFPRAFFKGVSRLLDALAQCLVDAKYEIDRARQIEQGCFDRKNTLTLGSLRAPSNE